ncbi:hypothetical protein STA3757_46210 [Stanieria sp. NIES-3757]|nr:hypothetical protein STA3757_46210 [Stanieria sp. NIES-3757]
MNQPALFDIVELLVDLPEDNLKAGDRGTIVECYNDNAYEIEFTNSEGETIALCTLSLQQFVTVWQAKTKSWLSLSEQITAIVKNLDLEYQKEVFKFARSLHN